MRRNNVLAILCPILALVLLAPLAAETVVVRKIKVTGNATTQEAVVRSLILEAQEGQTVERRDLEDSLVLLENRLLATKYFSGVRVQVVDSAAQPGAVNLVVEVEEGFLYRFGGGAVYGAFGVLNLGGSGRDVAVKAGTTVQGATYAARLLEVPGLTYQLGIENALVSVPRRSGVTTQEDRLTGTIQASKDWGNGWTTGLSGQTQTFFGTDLVNPGFRFIPGATAAWDRVDTDWSPRRGFRAHVSHASALPLGLHREGADLRAYFDLEPVFAKLAFRLQASVLAGLDAVDDRDALCLSGLEAVRKPFSGRDLGRAMGIGSAELRSRGFVFVLVGFVPVDVEPALVADVGQVWDTAVPASAWAWGGALRVRFSDPVNLPLRFEYTVDGEGRGLFRFAAEAPF